MSAIGVKAADTNSGSRNVKPFAEIKAQAGVCARIRGLSEESPLCGLAFTSPERSRLGEIGYEASDAGRRRIAKAKVFLRFSAKHYAHDVKAMVGADRNAGLLSSAIKQSHGHEQRPRRNESALVTAKVDSADR